MRRVVKGPRTDIAHVVAAASEARGCSPGTPSPRAPPTDRNVQVIVEIEARAATVERLFMISERQEWTFGQALEYALDALELALAKTATG